ncbi:hypothetical protein RB595_001474 [Gaeumannomyces hyphopodioides]
MASYTINEPHPTVPQNSYAHSGRGGAGNTFRVSTATTPPAGIPTKATAPTTTSSSSSSATRFYSGRGGAGNAHQASERVAMSLDAEYADAARHASASKGYVGRGGAGNVFSPATAATPDAAATGSARRDSASTDGSEKSGFWGRLSGSYRR